MKRSDFDEMTFLGTIKIDGIIRHYKGRKLIECFTCVNHAAFIIMFEDTNEITLIGYQDYKENIKETLDPRWHGPQLVDDDE